MRWLLALAIVLLCARTAVAADIYEWRDANGHRHFTNSMINVPQDRQPTTRVIVTGLTDVPSSAAELTPDINEPRREAQVVYDYSQRRDPYLDGIRDGLALASNVEPVSGRDGDVFINGPLAVSQATAIPAPPLYPAYYPFVTTSFDRGRSRHLTLRMLLQDQFQLDRDGPYAYERLVPVGLGPNLSPVLTRGLPRHRTRRSTAQTARVRTR